MRAHAFLEALLQLIFHEQGAAHGEGGQGEADAQGETGFKEGAETQAFKDALNLVSAESITTWLI
ncbi:MAG: hypothetical protein M3N41_09635 [Acidobacteriota bacterium]|nr:hypothetical protein [Acidobacteriota bacterium]